MPFYNWNKTEIICSSIFLTKYFYKKYAWDTFPNASQPFPRLATFVKWKWNFLLEKTIFLNASDNTQDREHVQKNIKILFFTLKDISKINIFPLKIVEKFLENEGKCNLIFFVTCSFLIVMMCNLWSFSWQRGADFTQAIWHNFYSDFGSKWHNYRTFPNVGQNDFNHCL